MSRGSSVLYAITVIGLSLGVPGAAHADIKCWINKDGVRECGNIVPPEYAQEAQTEVSKTGVTTGRKERAKTAEELEQERQLAAAKTELERHAAEQAAADQELLDTYSSEEDIVRARDGKIADIDAYITITQNHLEKLNKNLNDIIQQAAALEQRGEQPGENVARNIDNVRGQIREQETFIAGKRVERETVKQKYNADLLRYREIKARTAAGQAQPEDTVAADVKTP